MRAPRATRRALLVVALLAAARFAGAGDSGALAERVDALGDALPARAVARLGTRRLRGAGRLAFSRDGTALVCAQSDGARVRVFDVPSGKELSDAGWASEAVPLDRSGLLVLGDGRSVRVRDTRTGSEVGRIDLPERDAAGAGFPARAISPDGSRVALWENAGAGKRRLRLLATRTRGEVLRLESASCTFESIAISPDSRHLASARSDGAIGLWDLASRKECVLADPGGAGTPCSFSEDARILASWRDDAVLLWDAATGKLARKLPSRGPAAFSRDGKLVAAEALVLDRREEAPIVLWDTATGEAVRALPPAWSFAFSPRDDVFAACRAGRIDLVEPRTGKDLCPRTGHPGPVTSLAFLGNGERLVSLDGGTAIVWDTATSAIVTSLAFSADRARPVPLPDGTALVAAVSSGTRTSLVCFDLETGTVRKTLDKVRAIVCSLAVSRDGKTIAIGAHDGTVRLVDPETGRETRMLAGGEGRDVVGVAFSPDGKKLAIGRRHPDSIVDLTAEDGEIRPFDDGLSYGAACLDFSRDGKLVAGSSSSCGAIVWDVETRKTLHRIQNDGRGECVAFTGDGRTFAVGGGDGAVHLYDLETGRAVRDLDGNQGGVLCLALSPDGSRLASGGADGTVLLWDVSPR